MAGGAADAELLADGVCGVEPHEPEQPVGMNAGEQVGDLRRLAGGRHRAGLGDEYRIAGELPHGPDRRPEQGSELPVWLEVIAVDSNPVHVRTAGPPLGRAGDTAAPRVVDDVHRPQPGDVPGSQRAEEADDVPPGGDERRRGRVPVTPGVPVAVHLVAEAHDDRVAVGAHGLGVGTQVAVVPSGSDAGHADAVRIHLHERRRAVAGCGRGELSRERHIPSAVVHGHVWLGPGGTRERGQPGVRVRDPLRVHPEVGTGRGREVDRQWPGGVVVSGSVVDDDARRDRGRRDDRGRGRHDPPRRLGLLLAPAVMRHGFAPRTHAATSAAVVSARFQTPLLGVSKGAIM